MNIEIRRLTPDLAENYAHFFDITPHNVRTDGSKCYCITWCSDNIAPKKPSLPSFPQLDSTVFSGILDLMNIVVNPDHVDTPVHLTYKKQINSYHYSALSAFGADPADLTISRQLLDIIRSGSIPKYHEFFDRQTIPDSYKPPELATDSIRSAKNTMIYSISQISYVAVEEGVPQSVASVLTDKYITKVESLKDYDEILRLIGTMMFEFCSQVAVHHSPRTDSCTVEQIYRYVAEHLQERILVEDIADALKLKPAYLSNHFKNHTGMTLTRYIQKQKIREAKYLLDTSSLALSEIANYLGYSSQQKFQRWFREIAGNFF